MSVRAWMVFVLLCVVSAAWTVGQTTQPAPAELPAWGETIGSLAKVLTDESDEAALSAALPDEVTIHRLGANDTEGRSQLRQRTSGLTIVTARAYAWPAETIAADMAADVRACQPMPDALRKQFTPRDGTDEKRANGVAQQWMAGVLRPTDGQFVAVIVLWEPPPSITTTLLVGSAANVEVKRPIFVLVRGHKSDDGQVRVLHIAYGDSRQALN